MSAATELAGALVRLECELSDADDHQLAVGLAELARFRAACDAVWLRAVAEVDRRALHRREGARDVATWLAGLSGDRKGTTRRDVELAKDLADVPVVADALAAGAVSKAKAVELVRGKHLPDDVQEALVGAASTQAVEQVAAAVERARLAHGTQAPPPPRRLTVTRMADHATIEGAVDLVEAEILDVALSTMVESLDLPVEMPYGERRAHALVGLARHYLEHQGQVTGRLGRPHVVVLVDLEVLEARAGGSAVLASGTVISGDQARRLAEDANISRVVTKGRSEPLDVGRSTRSVPPAIAKAVITRDRHCRYRGCAAPPWACDVHHREPWARGGPTALHNLGLLCWHHHEHVHRRGAHHVGETRDGRWTLDVDTELDADVEATAA
jgi:Domain of unknown function (DUF222)